MTVVCNICHLITLKLGPMVQYDEGTAVLSGIVSFGYGCGQVHVPAIYTKVDHFLPWINQLMKKYSLR